MRKLPGKPVCLWDVTHRAETSRCAALRKESSAELLCSDAELRLCFEKGAQCGAAQEDGGQLSSGLSWLLSFLPVAQAMPWKSPDSVSCGSMLLVAREEPVYFPSAGRKGKGMG